MKLAAFDLGSNTIKVTVAERTGPGTLRILKQHAEVTRIGEGLDTHGALLEEAMDRTFRCLSKQVQEARTLGVEHMACVATAGMRGAANAGDFLARVKDQLGLSIEIIDGLREAELAFRAPSVRFGPGALLVVDVGGRSTELIAGRGQHIEHRVSLEIGGVRLTERFIHSDPPGAQQVEAVRAYARDALSSAPSIDSRETVVVAVSGTVLSLLGIQEGEDEMSVVVGDHDGTWLRRSSVERTLADLASKTTAQRIRGTVVPPGRADVIVAGTAIVLEVLEHYGMDRMRVTDQGVRFGLLLGMEP